MGLGLGLGEGFRVRLVRLGLGSGFAPILTRWRVRLVRPEGRAIARLDVWLVADAAAERARLVRGRGRVQGFGSG